MRTRPIAACLAGVLSALSLDAATGQTNGSATAVASATAPGAPVPDTPAGRAGNAYPNPYKATPNWGDLPPGRKLGAAAGIDIDRDGRSVWVAERCEANSCVGSSLPMILKFDAAGKLVKAFGAGLLQRPHGITVDRDGNLWVTDVGVSADRTRGNVVIKFSPEGTVLLTLGRPGPGGREPGEFIQPNDVAIAPNGNIYVAESHNSQDAASTEPSNSRITVFSPGGTLITTFGKAGSGPGEFRGPHALAFDSRGRLFVADRGNDRVQILDAQGRFIAEWKQFGRPSGIAIRNDVLVVSDSESGDLRNPGGWKRGVRIGSARTGTVQYFIPFLPEPARTAISSGMEGVTVDAAGNVYTSSVYQPEFNPGGPPGELRRFARH